MKLVTFVSHRKSIPAPPPPSHTISFNTCEPWEKAGDSLLYPGYTHVQMPNYALSDNYASKTGDLPLREALPDSLWFSSRAH